MPGLDKIITLLVDSGIGKSVRKCHELPLLATAERRSWEVARRVQR